ncbi:uncharacterized protein LOC128957656 [Oppia nitens]|uniref:uncharacterized protein LOC128957656 n=1 Tax=Oppia nitens TaxID=1686743 RepID=UPI0023DA5592|nr:uncharacterized protein LOC128957656 [Oppia nitens]
MDSKPTVRSTRSGSATLLQIPSERYGSGINRRSSSGIKFNEILFEEESDVIKSCCEMSSAVLGLMKSFSTSDICGLNETSGAMSGAIRQSSSEVLLFGGISRLELPNLRRLDYTSRSCSTWVNLGDPVLSTSQLPSPQAQSAKQLESPTISSVEFIKSVNKKVRQMYLRRRLRAIGRLYNSCQINVNEWSSQATTCDAINNTKDMESIEKNKLSLNKTKTPNLQLSSDNSSHKTIYKSFDLMNLCFRSPDGSISLTVKDIERQKGKPLSKYDRNIMIFNWLQSVNEDIIEQQTDT